VLKEELQSLQGPLKQEYRDFPQAAVAELTASGNVNFQDLTCSVVTPNFVQGETVSGLHPRAGGDGAAACSGDMLLQSLVACSGVTFAAVATAMELTIESTRIDAVGTMDFRGTLGVDRDTPVGLTSIELAFAVNSSESEQSIQKLIELTERYCVVLQTLQHSVAVTARRTSSEPGH